MAELARLQQDFSAALAARPVQVKGLALRGEANLGARRFAVYRNNVRLMRMNALIAVYPLIKSIVGEEFFTGMAREYAITHESTSGDLNEYGEAFAVFLESFEPARDLPYLPDVARLEWRVHRAYYAADGTPFDPARLAEVPEERWSELRFRFNPVCALLSSRWPLSRIREVNLPDYSGAMQVDFDGPETFVAVARPEYDVQVFTLAAGEYAWLDALAHGFTLAAALDAAAASQSDFDMAPALQRALSRGILADCRIADGDPAG